MVAQRLLERPPPERLPPVSPEDNAQVWMGLVLTAVAAAVDGRFAAVAQPRPSNRQVTAELVAEGSTPLLLEVDVTLMAKAAKVAAVGAEAVAMTAMSEVEAAARS